MNRFLKFFKNRKRWIFIGLGVLLISTTAAKLAHRHRAFYKFMPKEEIKAYFDTNIKPVLTEYRTNLDNELTASEKQQITEVKEALKALKDSKKEMGKALREKRKNGEEITPEEEAEMRSTMREMRKLTQGLWDIADAHSAFFDNMFEATSTQRKEWKEDIHDIVKTHRESMKEEMEKGEGKLGEDRLGKGQGFKKGRRGRGHEGFGHHGKHRGNPMMALAGPHAEVMFLLWDPSNPFFGEEKSTEFEQNAVTFPNPAANGSSLQYKVNQSGSVKIVMLNAKGEIEATLLEKQLEAGEYTLENNVSDLQSGVYFYKITTPEGTVTRRFVKE